MLISKEMYKFLKDYIKWIENGAVDMKPYSRCFGLCQNLEFYVKVKPDALCANFLLEFELKSLFEAEGLNRHFPFGENNSCIRFEYQAQHEDPIRLEWIKYHIKEYENSEKMLSLTDIDNMAKKIEVIAEQIENTSFSELTEKDFYVSSEDFHFKLSSMKYFDKFKDKSKSVQTPSASLFLVSKDKHYWIQNLKEENKMEIQNLILGAMKRAITRQWIMNAPFTINSIFEIIADKKAIQINTENPEWIDKIVQMIKCDYNGTGCVVTARDPKGKIIFYKKRKSFRPEKEDKVTPWKMVAKTYFFDCLVFTISEGYIFDKDIVSSKSF